MKYFLTTACLLIAVMVNAQIVNIPDSNFKFYLLNHLYNPDRIDINGNGEIEESEALTITRLHIQNFGNGFGNRDGGFIYDLTGISAFRNLRYLYFETSTQTIDLSQCVNLDTLGTQAHYLSSLDVSACHHLSYFFVEENGSFGTLLTNLVLGVQDSLREVRIDDSALPSLDLSGCKNLETISGNMPDLSYMNVTGCSNLSRIGLGNMPNKLDRLDLSSCYQLQSLQINSSRVIDLNLKNGSTLSNFYLADILPGSNICADEFELAELDSWFAGRNINITSYCTFFPGGNYNTVSGKARLDADNNGCSSTDRVMNDLAIRVQDTIGNSFLRFTIATGDYAHYMAKGVFTLTPYFPYPWFTVNPSSVTVDFDTSNSLVETRDFCIRPNGVHNDLEISFLPAWPPARPGFEASYTLIYKNRGTTTLSGNVLVNFDNSKMNFVTASENVTAQATGQLSWSYNNLQPFESKIINVTFNLLPPPVNNIGDSINYLAVITPSVNDETAFDNSFILPQRVRGSFDPNEKQCLEGSKLDISKIGDYLHYQIHFQNEGTDTAFNIVVADTLSDKLDWSSLELISSSHPVDVRQKNGKVEFIFENIKLPYKAINESASNGYVAFKIKPKPSVLVGDSLNNTAAIYFDFNMPVITNRATTIVTNTSTPVPVKVEYFSISSRSNINTLNWKAACSNGSAKFSIERSDNGIHFSSIGSITATAVRCQLPFNFYDNDPVAGKNYYRLKITDGDGISFYSKTLVAGNNKAGLQITGIANNIVYFTSNKQQSIQLSVIAADGRLVYSDNKNITGGAGKIDLQLRKLATGAYTIVVSTNGEVVTKRFIK